MPGVWAHADPVANFLSRAATANAKAGFRFNDTDFNAGRFDIRKTVRSHRGRMQLKADLAMTRRDGSCQTSVNF
jgi:hypothetical protein